MDKIANEHNDTLSFFCDIFDINSLNVQSNNQSLQINFTKFEIIPYYPICKNRQKRLLNKND